AWAEAVATPAIRSSPAVMMLRTCRLPQVAQLEIGRPACGTVAEFSCNSLTGLNRTMDRARSPAVAPWSRSTPDEARWTESWCSGPPLPFGNLLGGGATEGPLSKADLRKTFERLRGEPFPSPDRRMKPCGPLGFPRCTLDRKWERVACRWIGVGADSVCR